MCELTVGQVAKGAKNRQISNLPHDLKRFHNRNYSAMTKPNAHYRREYMRRTLLSLLALLALAARLVPVAAAETKKSEPAAAPAPLAERLKALPFKIAWECYVDGNWEIFVMNADGSQPVNLTHTPKVHEHYPQVSPDGTKICFTVDSGEGRATVRSLWVMDIDGKNRRQIADHAREPFWAPDGKTIGYLPQEFPRFDVIDFSTKGMVFYHLDSGKSEPHRE